MTPAVAKAFSAFEDFVTSIDCTDAILCRDRVYEQIERITDIIEDSPDEKEELRDHFFTICQKFAKSPLHRRARNKPLGYAGDYLLIDWIYTNQTLPNGPGQILDAIFQNYEASQAVRNRKDYFIKKCLELSHSRKGQVDILDVASGPCRDVLEAFNASSNGKNMHFHCIDQEPDAILYAESLLKDTKAQANVKFECSNIIQMKINKQYDMVWTAGLFDYFEDRVVVLMLKKFWRYLKEDGQIIFGNFGPYNPTRKTMELIGQWNLIHRSAEHLISLVEEAKIPFSEIKVENEPLGINLFCNIKK